LTNDELADIESLILLVIEKQRGTLDLTAKDVVKARNMQRTYMLATMIPRTGANPVAVTNIFPAELPATGSSERNVLFLLMSLLGVIGLATTLFWKRA
jgi:LPXTG-motif cell wall-anchored protein